MEKLSSGYRINRAGDDVAGLAVADAIGNDGNTIAPGGGIRLSRGTGNNGGLTLQIGGTSDSFNQMKVSVSDMHTKAMGINDIDISTQM